MGDKEKLITKWKTMIDGGLEKRDERERFWKELTLKELQEFIGAGVDINAKGDLEFKPIDRVAENSEDPAIIKKFIDEGADIHSATALGSTPLHWAAQKNPNPAVIKELINAGVDVNAKTKHTFQNYRAYWGNTALHFAAKSNRNIAVIKELINAGADINSKNNNGETPFLLAVRRGNSDFIKEAIALLKPTP